MIASSRGSILIVGAATEELLSAVRALESLAETTLAPPAEALGALARTDPGVFIVEDRDRALLAEAAALRPAIVRILLRPADGPVDGLDPWTVVLPRLLDVQALRSYVGSVAAAGGESDVDGQGRTWTRTRR